VSTWTLSIVHYSKNYVSQYFANRICFHPQVRRETPTPLGPLERVNLNHWILPPHVRMEANLVPESLCSMVFRVQDDGKSLNVMYHHQEPLE
jgi:hypothetical protein